VSTGPYAAAMPLEGGRLELVERVPAGAAVLDVGCWSGSVGSHLVDRRSATVDGVEPNPQAAAMASGTYRRVYVEPVEEALSELLETRRGHYDAILFLDVLEHLVDPGAVLSAAKALLTSGGHALVSLPNVGHWSVRKELLLGRWEYTDTGLLDRSHLRFFTLSTAARLLEDRGWEIVWRSISLGQPPLIRLSPRRLELLRFWPTLFGVQSLFEIRPR
jgi:2-polyprenyl-3-methyl-5-hydroxy-6-metoxy-1,4-benzoquinol methylase